MAVTWRMLDLPLYFLLPFVILLIASFKYLIIFFLSKITGSNAKLKHFNVYAIVLVLFVVADYKINILNKNIDQLNLKYLSLTNNTASPVSTIKRKKLYNLNNLANQNDSLKIWEQTLNEAIDLITIKKKSPNAVVYISVIDLGFPNLEIFITPELKEKYYTTAFAKTFDCDIAINGEAGETMQQDGVLGQWRGNWFVKGKAILNDDTPERPFLSFNQFNQAEYYQESIFDTTVNDDKYNTIWGRFDLLLDGKYTKVNDRNRPYSRTIMAINKAGTKLFLMVVDGKRAGYSLGLTYEEAAKILLELGAWNGMACDQGGSSCMYVKQVGGLINRPADSDGLERPVYSHFGVRVN